MKRVYTIPALVFLLLATMLLSCIAVQWFVLTGFHFGAGQTLDELTAEEDKIYLWLVATSCVAVVWAVVMVLWVSYHIEIDFKVDQPKINIMNIQTVTFTVNGEEKQISRGDSIRFQQDPTKETVMEGSVVAFETSSQDPTSVSVCVTKDGHKVYESQIRGIKHNSGGGKHLSTQQIKETLRKNK